MHPENLGLLEWATLFIGAGLMLLGVYCIARRIADMRWPWDDWRQTWQRWLKR